jgi:transposase InsO family protein
MSCAAWASPRRTASRTTLQTQGKVERFQQTLKNWLTAQAPQPATLAQLQALLDAFTSYYNRQRPHKSLPGLIPPAAATGELLRELTLDPARNYQPTGKPRRPKPRTP